MKSEPSIPSAKGAEIGNGWGELKSTLEAGLDGAAVSAAGGLEEFAFAGGVDGDKTSWLVCSVVPESPSLNSDPTRPRPQQQISGERQMIKSVERRFWDFPLTSAAEKRAPQFGHFGENSFPAFGYH